LFILRLGSYAHTDGDNYFKSCDICGWCEPYHENEENYENDACGPADEAVVEVKLIMPLLITMWNYASRSG